MMTPDSYTSASDDGRLEAAAFEREQSRTALPCLILVPAGLSAWEDMERRRLTTRFLDTADQAVVSLPSGAAADGLSRLVRHPVRSAVRIRRLARRLPRASAVMLQASPEAPLSEQLALPLMLSCYFGRRVTVDLRHRFAEMQLESTTRIGFWLLARAERVLVASEQQAARLTRRGIPAVAIAPAVDTERIVPRMVERVQPRLLANLSVGSEPDSPPIGWRCLIEGFELVRAKYPRAELNVLIDGVSNDDLAADNNDLPGGITLHSTTDAVVVDRCFAQADCFVNPMAVGNPIGAVLHAMACGLPVLSTKVGIVPEIINDRRNGLFVSPNHPTVLAQRVIDLIESPELVAQLSLRASLTARRFSWYESRKQWSRALHPN